MAQFYFQLLPADLRQHFHHEYLPTALDGFWQQLAIIKQKEEKIIYDHGTMTHCIHKGYLQLIKWLWQKHEIFVPDTASIAAYNGHIHILQWLRSEEGELYNRKAQGLRPSGDTLMETHLCAAGNGQIKTLEFLFQHDKIEDAFLSDEPVVKLRSKLMVIAFRKNQIAMIKWLLSYSPPKANTNKIVTYDSG